jgi:hypothetical protein
MNFRDHFRCVWIRESGNVSLVQLRVWEPVYDILNARLTPTVRGRAWMEMNA